MVEIIYGDSSELVDLTGMSVADARRRYGAKFGISGGAKARLNHKSLNRKQEKDVILGENDVLHFTEVNRLKQVLVGALVLAFAASASMFAYTVTSASTTITASSGGADFASVTANNSVASYTVHGKYAGAIGGGNLFDVTPSSGFTGDFEVNVYLTNLNELTETYGLFLMQIRMVDSANSSVDVEAITKPLTLNNGSVNFLAQGLVGGTTYYINTTGGIFRSYPWSFISGSINSPSIFCDVTQAGA